jgi:outer membrane protein
VWNLSYCIEYARTHNLNVQQSRLAVKESQYTLQQSKEALLPSVSLSSNLGLSSGKVENVNGDYLTNTSLSNSYSLGDSLTLFDGLSNYYAIKQSKLQTQEASLNAQTAENDIVVSLINAYLEWLYARENLEIYQQTAATSKANVELSQRLLQAGSITKSDFSQVKAQYSTDLYNVVTAQNTLESRKLALKQLLELPLDEPFELVVPDLQEETILTPLPALKEVYTQALNTLPEIQRSQLALNIATLNLGKTKSTYYPRLSLSAGINSGYNNKASDAFRTQLSNNLGQSVGLSLSIPLYDRGSTRTAVQKAKLQIESAKLDYTAAEKDLLTTIESIYQDAVAAQSKFLAAKEQLAAAAESYRLTDEQYRLGMKNTVEWLQEKDNYLEAQKSVSQAKYGAILSQKLLTFYQTQHID